MPINKLTEKFRIYVVDALLAYFVRNSIEEILLSRMQ